MDRDELRAAKIELLDDLHELATDPVADLEPVRQRVEALFARLESENGEEKR
jgi:hypothetical protein